jgi:hypothetical protein
LEAPIAGSHLSPIASEASSARSAFAETMRAATGANAVAGGLKVKVTPNPSNTYFTLTTSSNSEVALTITLSDVSGRVVEKRTQVAANGTIKLGNDLGAGIYFVEVKQGAQRERIKLLKQ